MGARLGLAVDANHARALTDQASGGGVAVLALAQRRNFGKFHVPSGKVTVAPCFIALKTFKTEVRDGQVFVDLDKPATTAAAS